MLLVEMSGKEKPQKEKQEKEKTTEANGAVSLCG
jgi:hypothetical protein